MDVLGAYYHDVSMIQAINSGMVESCSVETAPVYGFLLIDDYQLLCFHRNNLELYGGRFLSSDSPILSVGLIVLRKKACAT